MAMKKLFPKKSSQERDEVEAELKGLINRLDRKSITLLNRANSFKQAAKKYLKAGNQGTAKLMLARKMKLEKQAHRFQNINGILERHIDALDTAGTVNDLGNALKKSSKLLQKMTSNMSAEKAAAIGESSEEALSRIEEAGDLLGGDLDSEFGIEVEDELNKLEADILLEEAGGIPTAPASEGPEFIEEGEKEEHVKVKGNEKEKLKREMEKLKKELES